MIKYMKKKVTGFFAFMSKEKILLLENELTDRKKKIKELREDIRKIKKERRIEKSNIDIKMSQLRVQEYRLVMKESKINDLILLKEEQIKRAMQAERDFENGVRDVNVLLRTKTITAQNAIKELKLGKEKIS